MDIRDTFFIGGLAMLGYGLYLWIPWVAFAVVGALLMVVGYIMREPGEKSAALTAGSSQQGKSGEPKTKPPFA